FLSTLFPFCNLCGITFQYFFNKSSFLNNFFIVFIMVMRQIFLIFALINASFASFAQDLVRDHELDKILEYTSLFEIADTIVDYLCKEFPDLEPSTREEMVLLKREFVHFLISPVDVQNEIIAGTPCNISCTFSSKHTTIPANIAQLRDLAEKEFEDFSDETKKVVVDADRYLNFHVHYPVMELLERKMASYEERGLSERQIKMEIKQKAKALVDLWHYDDPEAWKYVYEDSKRSRAD
ncbi:hypothetical protein PMAYCL1PPCAC_06084, partial [Pristionchus mayeri]